MAHSSIPLTSLTEAQRAQAQKRFTIIRPALEDGITQAQVARTHNVPAPTVRRWMKHYRDKGLAGLADAATRSDKGKSRRLPPDAISLIEGLGLATSGLLSSGRSNTKQESNHRFEVDPLLRRFRTFELTHQLFVDDGTFVAQ